MVSFLKNLFAKLSGGAAADGAEAQPAATKEIEHNGFTIRATPYKEGGQYQLCGVIEKEINGEVKSHRFIRAERFPSLDDVVELTLSKGKQIIDQSGEKLFS